MDFLQRDVKALGRSVYRLGLAANYGIDEDGIRAAIDRGVNYFFYTVTARKMKGPLREVLKQSRERYVVAAVPTFGFFGGSVRRGAESMLKALGTDYLDVFQLGWLGVTSAWTDATIRELQHLKESGKVRALGVSIHDRVRAGKLAEDSPLDMLMVRYNAAHPGAEKDIFPFLAKRNPMLVAYTATSWRKLLKAPSGWDGPVMSAGDCYRWCLSNPNVDVVLTGPKDLAQFEESYAAVQKGPLTEDEVKWMGAFGKAVHG